jgi:hypothetical protein
MNHFYEASRCFTQAYASINDAIRAEDKISEDTMHLYEAAASFAEAMSHLATGLARKEAAS